MKQKVRKEYRFKCFRPVFKAKCGLLNKNHSKEIQPLKLIIKYTKQKISNQLETSTLTGFPKVEEITRAAQKG